MYSNSHTSNIILYTLIFCIALISCGSKETDNVKPLPDTKTPIEEGVSIKIMSYNLWASRPGYLKTQNMIEMAEVIKRANPDLVALQEVDYMTGRNPFDVTKELAERSGMPYYYFVKAMNYSGGEYGEAILSKYPLKEKKAYDIGFLPEYPKSEPRAMAFVTIEKEGKVFHFAGTHLDHEHEANRNKQAKDIVDILKKYTNPVFLAGDLNAVPDSEAIRTLRSHFTLGCISNNCAFTFPASNPNKTIDYIMYSPSSSIAVKSYQAYTWGGQASDHLPIVATFTLK